MKSSYCEQEAENSSRARVTRRDSFWMAVEYLKYVRAVGKAGHRVQGQYFELETHLVLLRTSFDWL